MISRNKGISDLKKSIRRSPISAILGPRQCGKTTLARQIASQYTDKGGKVTFFDCESMPDVRKLENAEYVLSPLTGLVIIDEIQIKPELFGVLRVLADRPSADVRFLILGGASPSLIKNASESLAGRIEFIELTGFSLTETGPDTMKQLWTRGGFPRSFLAESEEDSVVWRENFIRTFLERDIPQLGITIPQSALRRFWTMLAHFHGQIWNASDISRSMGLSDKTVRSYLDILTGTFMIRQLQPWHENISKRQVKAPKIYFRDTGLLHQLLEIPDENRLLGNPRCGASWEGFALEETLRLLQPDQAWFWSVHSGPELDLLITQNGRRIGFEFKMSEAPKITASIKHAVEILSLDTLYVVYPGKDSYAVSDKIRIIPLHDLVFSLSKENI